MDKDKIILELIRKVELLTKRVQQLEVFEEENKNLRKENAVLKQRLTRYEHPNNSNNSSIPPSKDENRPKRNQGLREKTGRKPGGQAGRKGNTLKMVEPPMLWKNIFLIIVTVVEKTLVAVLMSLPESVRF